MSEGTSKILEFSEDIATQEAPVPLPKRDYVAQIRGAETKVSKTSGNEYVAVTFFIPPEQYPADYTEGNPEGSTLGYNRLQYADTHQARFRLRKFCEAIGAAMGRRLDLNGWIGLSALVTIDHETFEGEPRAFISKVSKA